MTNSTIAPGTSVRIRDEEWLIRQVDRTSSGIRIFGVVGLSPLVEGKEARFLEDIELQNGEIEIVDPRLTKAVADHSPFYRESRLLLESHLRASTPNDTALHIGHQGAMDVLPFQIEPTTLALSQPRQRILIADAGDGPCRKEGWTKSPVKKMSELTPAQEAKRERFKTDPRYNDGPGIICLHCKHLVSTGGQYDPEGWTCAAFPSQILYGILTNREAHTEPYSFQPVPVVFEPKQLHTEQDTGRKWHWNADSSWSYADGKGGEDDLGL